jgi:oxygen-dependent protoporphyrinogen oxidase
MAQPMVGGIYTADPEKLSLQATMPRFLEMESKQRSLIRALRKQNRSPADKQEKAASSYLTQSGTSGARYSLFLSFDRGMQLLTDTLAARISASGKSAADGTAQVSVLLNTVVQSLENNTSATSDTPKWIVKTNATETIVADALCLALPAYQSAKLLRSVDEVLAVELDAIPYASSATINLAYKREDIGHTLDGFGFVVPFIEKRTVMACTFSSVKFAGRAPEGFVLLRAFVGGALQPQMLDLEDGELLSRVLEDLGDLLGIARPPLFTEVARWERAMPQYHIGHLARLQRIDGRLASLSGLALAGNAYSGLGIPDCIRSGEAAADAMIPA